MADPQIRGIYETVLYATPTGPTVAFYREVLGLKPIGHGSDLGGAFRLPDGGVLLIFDPALSSIAGRLVPTHGRPMAAGAGHAAFSVAPGEYGAWIDRLRRHGVVIEHEHTWAPGGRSVYFRDPAGNSVELVDGQVWET
ncbi:MAG: VOC family protein [Phycisphaeraceae bacterium]|nr:VOC family protein [Phycisphaeraceae bacterium]